MVKSQSMKNQPFDFEPGQFITGKWHGRRYKIIRLIGEGAVGRVYLAARQDRLVALKIAYEAVSVSSEVHVLRRVSKVRGLSLGPSFLDMDDVITPEGTVTFYAMEYIRGDAFLPFVQNRGIEWVALFVVQLLNDLSLMHKENWVFGDLKPENLLVTQAPFQVRWIDPGGITKAGRSIKEYTEFFDRGYWGAGDRKAEPSYDLFAVAMLIVNKSYPSRFHNSQQRGRTVIMDYVSRKQELSLLAPVIEKGIYQTYTSANEMKSDVIKLMSQKETKRTPSRRLNKRRVTYAKRNAASGKAGKRNRLKERQGVPATIIFASFLLFVYVLYLTG